MVVRRESRQAIHNAHLILHQHDSDRENSEYTIHNISRGGLRFSANDIFILDQHIKISVLQSSNEIHQANGRICYCENSPINNDGSYYGLSFLDNFMDMSRCTTDNTEDD